MKERLAREDIERKEKEEEQTRLNILLHKKAKSIAGAAQEDQIYVIEGDFHEDAVDY